jgi:hypothetical protein
MILVAIISPAYLKSQFCMVQEMEHFLDEFGREVIQLQKVRLTGDDTPPLPDALYESLFDDAQNAPFRGEQLELRLNRIIAEIRQKLETARDQCHKVYLAQPRSDFLKVRCQELGSALHEEYLAVLPNQIVTSRTIESKIRKWIEDAAVSVHVRSDAGDPLLATQLKIAKETGLPTLVLETPPTKDQIPGIVQETITLISQTKRYRELYFIYDYHSDHEYAAPLSAMLAEHTGRRITSPQQGETYHRAKIRESDGVLLFRRNAPCEWFDSHREKLAQAAALSREKTVQEVVYVSQPGTPEQVVVRQGGAHRWEINRTGLPNLLDLLPFLNALPQIGGSVVVGGTT